MKIRTAILSLCFAAGLMGVSHGAAYTLDFEGYDTTGGAPVAGQDNWTINDPTTGLSFTLPYNGTTAAGLGGRFTDSTLPVVQLSHSIPTQTLVDTTLSFDLALIASSGVLAANEDRFGFSIKGAGGTDLLTFIFIPSTLPGEDNFVNVSYSVNGNPFVESTAAFQYGGPTEFDLTISGSGADATFFAEFTALGSAGFSGTIPGGASSSVEEFSLNFTKTGASSGNNYMIADNIVFNQVPEVSSSLLVLGAAAPLLARRRRK